MLPIQKRPDGLEDGQFPVFPKRHDFFCLYPRTLAPTTAQSAENAGQSE
jgi:hypothetical protein